MPGTWAGGYMVEGMIEESVAKMKRLKRRGVVKLQ